MSEMGYVRGFLEWVNARSDGELALLGVALAIAGWILTVGLPWLWKQLFGSISRYQQWRALADQFHDIAKRDNDVQLPTDKKKVSVAQYLNELRFVDGVQSHHATETEALSRIAGMLLSKSRVPHRRYWRVL